MILIFTNRQIQTHLPAFGLSGFRLIIGSCQRINIYVNRRKFILQ